MQNLIFAQRIMNPIRFVPIVEPDLSGGFPYTLPLTLGNASLIYQNVPFDHEWYIKSLLPWQLKIDYAQKVQFSQEVCIQLDTAQANDISVKIYNCHRIAVATLDVEITTSFPGNTYSGQQLNTYQYRWSFRDLALNTGRYYVVAEVFLDATIESYISEPIQVANNFPGTVLIQYKHSQNRYDTLFTLQPNYQFRVEAELIFKGIGYIDSEFEGQRREKFITYSEKIRKYDFQIGTKIGAEEMGVPMWVFDKVAEMLRCDHVLIDNSQIVRIPNTDPEPEEYGSRPLISATFKLYEQDRQQTQRYGILEASGPFISEPADPYMLAYITMGGFLLIPDSQIISGLTNAEAVRDYLNTLTQFKGSFRLTGTRLVYSNAPDERYTSIEVIAMFKQTSFYLETNGTLDWAGFQFSGETIVMDYGYIGVGAYEAWFNNGGLATVSKTMPGVLSLHPTIWHNDNIEILRFLPSTLNGYSLSSLDDATLFPTALFELSITDNYLLETLHNTKFDDWASKTPNLLYLIIHGSLTAFDNDVFFNDVTGLTFIDVSNNMLGDFDIEQFLSGLSAWFNIANTGYVNVKDQDPYAGTTPTAAGYVTALQTAGWNVQIDP